MENEDVKVVEQPKVEEPKKEEKPAPKTTAKKRGPKPKADSTPKKRTTRAKKDVAVDAKKDTATEKKATAKRGPKKTADKKPKTAVTAKKTATVPNYNFTRTVFEFDKKQFTEETINKKVLEYLVKHPYIHAEKIETFVNLEEKRIYFTVDGFGNADFSVDL
ncbi:MAG: hypothetical protein E7232_15415 [Lachnospiraceae bacterium]|jgi:septal ring-binding cell division protein DamX|nr:hypothetical protein [Lachnospiraceae bacterium]